jgi:catechol 2,3-dioxygenase-like lactoylglutathione lyase family enzyme
MATPPPHRGLRHLALRVSDIKKSRAFYERLFGMRVVWEPDPDNVYFSSGCDNLALHQISQAELADYHGRRGQYLDHVGVIMADPASVDDLYALVVREAADLGATIVKSPKQHRDGSYSFYVADPDGNAVQVLYEPAISPLEFVRGESDLSRP